MNTKTVRFYPNTAFRFEALPPLSLYVHYPWCVRKCPYCDFNSHEASSESQEKRYLDALVADLDAALPLIWGRRIRSIFIGGGTPSLLSARGLDRLLADIRARLPVEADVEITLEANPGTFEAEKFSAYRASGVNRLSIGVQSFNDEHLSVLGRIHTGAEACRAIDIARDCFDNINLDLMYALPGQTPDQSLSDIARALSFQPTHLSVYQLTLEPNTVFAKYPPILPDDDQAFMMQEAVEIKLSEAGFLHYEVSAYAQPFKTSRHNLNYWQFGDYLGIGAGAHSKLSFPERVMRQVRYKLPESYMTHALSDSAISETHDVTINDIGFEFMLNALRLIEGVPTTLFAERTGLPLTAVQKSLHQAQAKGLMETDPVHLKPTPLGRRFLNDLQALFLT